ncbi:MAG TPA: T9SS type A sorting domain-containing protein [Ignavibacteria bacterium]|nr:T9SS type A sorting domain-containing protein [Ignavibacteria bacterium]
MKKAFTLFVLFFIITCTNIFAQPWHYDFGNATGNFTSTTPSTTFLPSAPSGTSRVRVGSGGGSFNLENQIIPFGSDTYLRIAAPSTGAVNKFSVYDYSPTKTATIKFRIRLGANNGSSGVSSGIWYFFLGDGSSFSDNNAFTGAQMFTGLEITFGAGGSLTTKYRNGSSWSNTGLSGTVFSQGTDYTVEIYANNTTASQIYTYGTSQSLAAGKVDIWIDGILAGDDLAKGQIANDVNIDSWMFYGLNSAGNAANIFLDEFDYHNDLAGTPLPVTLGAFTLNSFGRTALLSWSTLNEINNSGFQIERSEIGSSTSAQWHKTGFVPGCGTINEPKEYQYQDNKLKAGKFRYRLKQVDYNGNFEYFYPSNSESITIAEPREFGLYQNYPNPSNPVSRIDYQLPYAGIVNLTVFDITGKAVKELVNGYQDADYHTALFDGSNISSGIYFYRITLSSGSETLNKTMKMVLVK